MQNESPENSPSIQTTPFEEVAALCEAFTGEHSTRSSPSISGYLERVREDTQSTLLRNLLPIDIDQRRAHGEQPRVEEYLQRFPQHASLIREIFLEQSSVSSVASQGEPKPRVATNTPSVSRLGPYRLVGELGRGGMGVVYEAVHLQHGNQVALKTLPSLDGAALHRFKREFRSLADANHPNLIGLHKLEADGGQWFITMDLVEGMTFLKYVRPGNAPDESRLRAALAQLVTGVMALHGRHIIHRDLKPSNVMVTHGVPPGYGRSSRWQPVRPEPTTVANGLAALRAAIKRLDKEPTRAAHPAFGPMSREEWDQFHLRHAALHLSFARPKT